MIRGLCESALTFEAIMVWREELGLGRILLREVIDLEQTYGGQVAQALSDEAVAGEQIEAEPAKERDEEDELAAAPPGAADDDDDFDDGAGPTISAMEGELREGVMATLDAIAGEFEAFRRLQEKLVEHRLRGEDLTEAERKSYEAATSTIVNHLKTLKLNNNRIEALVDQLYAINRRLVALEGPPAAPRRQLRHHPRRVPARLPRLGAGPGLVREGDGAGRALDQVRRERRRPDRRDPPGDRRAGHRIRPADRRLPPHRPDRAEGRARGASGQEGNGRGEPAPGHLDRQEIHQPRPAIP